MINQKQNKFLFRSQFFVLAIVFLMIFQSLAKQTSPQKLELVVQIFRHGARQALIEHPMGLLENAGKVQLYNFGKILRERYVVEEKLLKEQFDPKQIYFHSSPKNRAMNSLFWLNSGLYPPLEELSYENIREKELEVIHIQGISQEMPPFVNITEDLQHQLHSFKDNIIVQASQVKKEYIEIPSGGDLGNLDTFYHAYNVCPFIEKFQSEVKYTDESKELEMDSKDVYATLAHYFNEETTITNQGQPFDEDKPKLKLIGRFLDFYACNSFMGRDLPVYTPYILKKMRRYKTQILDMKFRPSEIRKLCVTEHLHNMKEIMMNKFQAPSSTILHEDLKMMLYSCHDRNLYLLMMALVSEKSIEDVGYWHYVPPFASSISLKVYNINEQQFEEKKVYDLEKLEIEIYLNDIQLEWKNYNQTRISLKQFLNELIPSTVYPIEHLQNLCKTQDIQELRMPIGDL